MRCATAKASLNHASSWTLTVSAADMVTVERCRDNRRSFYGYAMRDNNSLDLAFDKTCNSEAQSSKQVQFTSRSCTVEIQAYS